ncbi:dsRBD fold-containing protein [Agromyces sp. NPDC058484]|uniref:dsRBD fold-containing protein n=1 Tax=Agromyces sp. NPDC058484 TaxID=3346524 RepID=UPI0036471DB6
MTGQDVTGVAQARRNPRHPSVPGIGDGLAVSRALRNLAERLLHATEKDISCATGEPAHLHR